jgi:hypothetical protein
MAVSFRVTGTWAELVADGTVAIPATPQAGDRMYLFARWKDFSITATVANWTELIGFADGSTATGNGTGSVKVGCWYRDWQSGDTDPTIDFSASPTNASVVIMVMAKAASDTWLTPVAVTAAMTNWTTTSQTVSASSTANVLGGGVVMGLIGIRDDTAIMTRPTSGIDDSAGAITWNGNYVESPATHHSTTTGDDGAADLGYRLVSAGATATLRMTGTISAAETGAALWVVQGVEANLTVQDVAHAHSVANIALTQAHSVVVASAGHTHTTTSVTLTQVHGLVVENAAHAQTTGSITLTEVYDLTVQNASHEHSVTTVTLTQTHVLAVANAVHAHIAQSPDARTFLITWLDPGGDAVQAVGHFNSVVTGAVSYDSGQQVAGAGSWKFDSDTGEQAIVKVPGVLGASRRISFYWRYESVLDDSVTVTRFESDGPAYSGGGFSNFSNLDIDNDVYATASPARNSGQGNALGFSGLESTVPPSAVIDSVKIIYERKYDVNTSIGISRVKTRIDGVEGPNYDNTDMPLVDTVVTVDITAERGWTPPDFNDAIFEVIAEARRGDTDTAHTQSWDYVKVEVVLHLPVGILSSVDEGGNDGLFLAVTPKGAGVVLRYVEGGAFSELGTGYDGITELLPNTDYRIGLSYIHHGLDDLDVNLYVNGVLELSLVTMQTGIVDEGLITNLLYGWIGNPGADHLAWFTHLYVDDGNDLSDPGNKLVTAKLPASVNQDNWTTTGGTGAVNERPLSETNYKQHSTSIGTVRQTYTLQAASAGDLDISSESIVGYMAWAWTKAFLGGGGGYIYLVANGSDILENFAGGQLTVAPSLMRYPITSTTYPSDADAIGMALVNVEDLTDATLYECGIVVCYEGPNTDDPLFPLQLLASSASTSDSMGGDPPAEYELKNVVVEAPSAVVTTVISSRTAEGEVPQQQAIIESQGGDEVGIVVLSPGVEVSVDIDVAGTNTSLELRRVDEIVI